MDEREAEGVILIEGVAPRKFIDFAINNQEHMDCAEWDIARSLFMVDYYDREPVEKYLAERAIQYEVYPFSEHPELAV